MTPKGKAVELYERFDGYAASRNIDGYYDYDMEHNCKVKCALITIEEILEVFDGENTFWQQVKTEIEKL